MNTVSRQGVASSMQCQTMTCSVNKPCPNGWMCMTDKCCPRDAYEMRVKADAIADASQGVASSMQCQTMLCSASKPCPNGWMCMADKCCPRTAQTAEVNEVAATVGCLTGDGKPCPDPRCPPFAHGECRVAFIPEAHMTDRRKAARHCISQVVHNGRQVRPAPDGGARLQRTRKWHLLHRPVRTHSAAAFMPS